MEKMFTSRRSASEIRVVNEHASYSEAFSHGNAFSRMTHNEYRPPHNTIQITDSPLYEINIEL